MDVVARVQAAALDGRLRALRLRQRILRSLHEHLQRNAHHFVEAARADDECSISEAQMLVAATMLEVRNHYDGLNLERDLSAEYKVSRGESHESRRVPAVIAYIIPDRRAVLFGVVSALSAAIEAGTCCLFEFPEAERTTHHLLRQCVSDLEDRDAFGIVNKRIEVDKLSQILVIQQSSEPTPLSTTSTARLSSAIPDSCVAIVDRTADLKTAATEIVAAKKAFQGMCPYSPAFVLINEFRIDSFLEILSQVLGGTRTNTENTESGSTKAFQTLVRSADIEVVQLMSRPKVLEIPQVPCSLVLIPVTSMDDAIDLMAGTGLIPAALYLFAGLKESKYLSQHISSRGTLVQHIPMQLLVGPVAPIGYPLSLATRYSREMFEEPSPEIVKRTNSVLSSTWLQKESTSVRMLSIASRPLQPTGQPTAGAWGFFEQGMVLGALVYLLPMLGCTIALGYRLGLLGWRTFVN